MLKSKLKISGYFSSSETGEINWLARQDMKICRVHGISKLDVFFPLVENKTLDFITRRLHDIEQAAGAWKSAV
jgi:hypothetical protein